MKLVVDGIIFERQTKGGISQIYAEILPRMCDLDPTLQVALYTRQDRLLVDPPQHPQLIHKIIPRVEYYLRPQRLWKRCYPQARRMLSRWCYGSGQGAIWHSTFFTTPGPWKGRQVATCHDLVFQLFPHLFDKPIDDAWRGKMRDCLLAADLVICVSENTGRDVQKFFGIVESKIRVVPNACNCIFRRLSATEFRQPPPTQRPFLLYVGNRYAYKNFDILLDAYGCWRQNADIDLVVVGPSVWTPDELVKLNRAGLGDRVKILTGIEDGHLVELYNRAHASVLPSLYEGFGIPLLEAMACGCPIVASRIPTTVEVAGDCPIYFEPSDRDSLTHALDEALAAGRESSRCLMGLGRAKLYSWSNTAKQTLAVYRELNLRSMAKESDQLFA